VRERLLSLFACTRYAVAVRGAQAFTEHLRRGIVRQFRQLRGGVSDGMRLASPPSIATALTSSPSAQIAPRWVFTPPVAAIICCSPSRPSRPTVCRSAISAGRCQLCCASA
jgi:hypothetical protein